VADLVLVTGGTGFIGGWCISTLLEHGFAVRTTVRSESSGARVRAVADGKGTCSWRSRT
jgi:uncharacterized protein YbjT (DUF2867 family)